MVPRDTSDTQGEVMIDQVLFVLEVLGVAYNN